MAVGDVAKAHVSIGAGSSYNIRPDSGQEINVHNIYVPNGVTILLYKTDGINDVLVETLTGSMLLYNFHLTYDCYLKLVNGGASPVWCGYDGIWTKV
jgi:hypothetical protein